MHSWVEGLQRCLSWSRSRSAERGLGGRKPRTVLAARPTTYRRRDKRERVESEPGDRREGTGAMAKAWPDTGQGPSFPAGTEESTSSLQSMPRQEQA